MSDLLAKIGEIIDGKYRIVRLLGAGGMGAVYEGENLRIRRRVAIKMLHASASVQPDVIARFEREAQAAAMVGSAHICEVLDVGELPSGARYMVMEYLEGETLSALIKRNGRLTPEQASPLVLQMLDALGAAHGAGIIHRDLKPDNVFLVGPRGPVANFVKILDFGVSKFTQVDEMEMTRSGAIVGTPYYMPPEQARASAGIDHRADIYSTGVLLYQASTGSLPFQADTFSELLLKIVLDPPARPESFVPSLPPGYSAIIMRAIARDPNDRFPSCAVFAEALRQFHGWPSAIGTAPSPAHQLSGLHAWTPPSATPPVAIDDPNAITNVTALTANGLGFAPSSSGPSASGVAPPSGAGTGAVSAETSSSGLDRAVHGNLLASSTTPAVAMSASSWGNASSASQIHARPKAGLRTIVGVIAGAVIAGGALALLLTGSMAKPVAPVDAPAVAGPAPSVLPTQVPVVSPPSPPVTPSAPSPRVTPSAPSTTVAPIASEVPVAAPSSAASDASSAPSQHAAPAPIAPSTPSAPSAKAAAGHPPAATAKAKPGPSAKPATTDLGY